MGRRIIVVVALTVLIGFVVAAVSLSFRPTDSSLAQSRANPPHRLTQVVHQFSPIRTIRRWLQPVGMHKQPRRWCNLTRNGSRSFRMRILSD